MLAGKPVAYYGRRVWFWAVLIVILEAVIIIIDRYAFLEWVIPVAVFVMLSWRFTRMGWKEASAVAGVCGFFSGVFLALFEIIWYHTWWSIFFLIARPITFVFIAIITGYALSFGRSLLSRTNQRGGVV